MKNIYDELRRITSRRNITILTAKQPRPKHTCSSKVRTNQGIVIIDYIGVLNGKK